MNPVKALWQAIRLMIHLGRPIKVDLTPWREKGWIRYGDIYIQVLEHEGTYSLAWQDTIPEHFPVRDILVAEAKQ